MEVKLTAHQEEKMEELLEKVSKNNITLLQGSAGVGKTTLAGKFVERLGYRPRILSSAPTNVATNILQMKMEKRPNVDFSTVHRALKMKMYIDESTGEKKFRPSYGQNNHPLMGYSYFIVDECSMINEEILDYIEEFAEKYNFKVIFMGDNKQLNPVGETDSPVFEKGYPTVNLTEIIRQKSDSPVITISRDVMNIKSYPSGSGFIKSVDMSKIIRTLAENNGNKKFKYLAYTNLKVNSINKKVRKAIYGSPRKVEEGETIVFNSPYGENYYNSQEIKVEDLEVKEKEFSYYDENLKGVPAVFKSIVLKYYLVNNEIMIVHERSEKDFNNLKYKLRKKAKNREINWADFYSFVDMFADFKYSHSCTIHKSQGSTYENVIIDYKNMMINKNKKELERLMYTAVTRTSNKLILFV